MAMGILSPVRCLQAAGAPVQGPEGCVCHRFRNFLRELVEERQGGVMRAQV